MTICSRCIWRRSLFTSIPHGRTIMAVPNSFRAVLWGSSLRSWRRKPRTLRTRAKKLQMAVTPYKGSSKGYGKGNDENQPPKCFYCQQRGHLAKDCPIKKADLDAGIIQPKAKGKGRPGVRARAKIVAKIEGDDDDA